MTGGIRGKKMSQKSLLNSTASILALLFLFGCAAKAPVELPPFSARQFDPAMYESKVDNFMIILDASSSMDNAKFKTAKAITERLNRTIPQMGQTAGLRSFGHASGVSKKNTALFYGMENYSTAKLSDKLKIISKPGGCSPMGDALDAVRKDLEGLSGVHNAVVIISDGLDMETTVKNARDLKDKFGSSICFYPILVGDSNDGLALLQEIARIGDCGFYSKADGLLTGAGMASFVQNVFLKEKKTPLSSKALLIKIEKKDSDNDGVHDDQDKCPGTPVGAKVDSSGCWALDTVRFDFDKHNIKPEATPLLDEVIVVLKQNPETKVELQGHTDNTGTNAYNKSLSMRRANAVANYLTGKGILKSRLPAKGYGENRPVASNDTALGRALNRRVEIHPF